MGVAATPQIVNTIKLCRVILENKLIPKSSDESCCGCLARKLHHHFSTSTKEGTSSQPRCLCRKMMSQEVL